MRKLAPNFSYSFPYKVWNTTISSDGNILVIELRDEPNMSTFFYVLDLVTLKFIHTDLSFEEKWWIGIASVGQDHIIFQTYEDGENPDSKKYFFFDIKSGTLLTDTQTDEMNIPDEHFESNKNNSLVLPFHYIPGTPYFETVEKFIAKLTGEKAQRAIDYYEQKDYIVLSYYHGVKDKLANNLLIVNMDREIMLNEVLYTELSGISDHSFFISHNNVIFVKENNDFLIYSLQ